MKPTHTCTTRLVPGVAWPDPPKIAPPKRPKHPGPLSQNGQVMDEEKVISVIVANGPSNMHQLAKHINISRHRVSTAIGRLLQSQPGLLGVVRRERVSSTTMAAFYGFLS